jgi:uncharacterized protein
MWHMTRAAAARWAQTLLHIHDTPRRTALAFGLGVAVGFSPVLGFHTAVGIGLAFALNLNRVATLAGVWVNLPWIMGPYYATATALGAWLTGARMPPGFLSGLDAAWNLATWRARVDGLAHVLRPLLLPYGLGSTIGALVLGFVAYRFAFVFLAARHRHHRHPVEEPGPPTPER